MAEPGKQWTTVDQGFGRPRWRRWGKTRAELKDRRSRAMLQNWRPKVEPEDQGVSGGSEERGGAGRNEDNSGAKVMEEPGRAKGVRKSKVEPENQKATARLEG